VNIIFIVFRPQTIQSRLLDIGSSIATPITSSSRTKLQRVTFASSHVENLESWIDAMDANLEPLSNFILPSGGKASSFLHLARTVCRRAERSAVTLSRCLHQNFQQTDVEDVNATPPNSDLDPSVLIYLNRLSDYLFTAARYMASRTNHEETIYQKAM